MLKILLLWLFLQPLPSPYVQPLPATTDCQCTTVSEVEVASKTQNSISIAWSAPHDATGFEVWYVRQSDNYVSGYFYPSGPAYTFTGLSPGRYSFYLVSICGAEKSAEYIVEDLIQG